MATDIRNDVVALTDLETSGLNEHQHEIIGYGVHIVDPFTLEILRSDEFKVKPTGPVDEGARAVNGYAAADWEGALSQADGVLRYREFLGNGTVTQFASWNSWFDRRFLGATLQRVGIGIVLDYHCIDLVGMFREKMWVRGTRLEKFSLDHAAHALGLEPEAKPHTPLRGATKALEVWRAMRTLA